jgi:signal transduction histidine kinase
MPEPLTPRPAASSAAGELADVVVHGLSAIAIQAEAAEAVLRSNPSMAADPLATIRVSALEALADMRRLLGALRQSGGDGGCGRFPQPGLEQLPGLVARACEDGQPVTLEVTGSPRALPASYQLAAFRVVQEALCSARVHAPGSPTTVSVTWTDASLQIEVVDGGTGGRDLTPLQERVLLHGGRLDAEAVPEGGYRIRATFPA